MKKLFMQIESKDGAKGVIVDAFGAYADDISSELISKLRYSKK